MATQSEKRIQELALEVNTLSEQVRTLRGETQLFRDVASQIAVLEHKVAELTKTKEVWGQRGWAIVVLVLTHAVTLIAGILIASYTRR